MGDQRPVPAQPEQDLLYADVIVPRHLIGPFTYRVSAPLKPVLQIGHRVLVPFGRSMVQGAVVALSHTVPQGLALARLKEVQSLVSDSAGPGIPADLFKLARRISEEYVAPLGQCLRLVVPPAISLVHGSQRLIVTEHGRQALASDLSLSQDEQLLLAKLSKRKAGITRRTLVGNENPELDGLVSTLIARKWIEESRPLRRGASRPDPISAQRGFLGRQEEQPAPAVLSGEWDLLLEPRLQAQQAARLVLQGPFRERMARLRRLARLMVPLNRPLLVLVAEGQQAEALAADLSQDTDLRPCCWHSELSSHRRVEIWEQIRCQEVSLVVGTRSAVFLPFPSLGAIWMEEEENAAFKEPQEPRYHARDVAWMRVQDHQALLVLGSSHASLETLAAGERDHSIVTISTAPISSAEVTVVDLRQQDRAKLLSPPLLEALRESIERKTGALLFLNRKGYAGALICRDCGTVPRCISCLVPYTYYRQSERLACGYCGRILSIPDTCTACGGARLHVVGEGTERVEEAVRILFPHATIVRVDGNSMKKPAQAEALWGRVTRREWDILVGTQLLLDDRLVPPVGLVGVVQADASLNLPDFRAAERSYHLMLDARLLAMPAAAGGRMVIQTYLPSHHAIQALAKNDAALFRTEELMHRAALGYPPALSLIALQLSSRTEKVVQAIAELWIEMLASFTDASKTKASPERKTQQAGSSGGLVLLGPVPPPVPKLRGRYRRQILVKADDRAQALRAIRSTVEDLEKRYPSRVVKLDVDVDPVEMW